MRYPFPVRGSSVQRSTWFLILTLILTFFAAWSPAELEARSSFWISARDQNACIVSAVVQYDRKLESRIRLENGIGNSILQMDVHTKAPQELCTMLMLEQKEHRWRPLLCVTTIRGNIYSGYLVLPEEFNLSSGIKISLGERTVEARFMK